MVNNDDLLNLNISIQRKLLVQAVLTGAFSLANIYKTDVVELQKK